MKNINRIRLIIECLITILLLWVFPFNIERKLKLFALYVFSQLIVGRFQNKTTLAYDEAKLVFLGYAGFLFCALLTVAFRSPSALYEMGYICLFTLIDMICSMLVVRYAHLIFYKKCTKNVIVIGAGKTARKLDNVTRANRFSLTNIRAFVNLNGDRDYPGIEQVQIEQRAPIISMDQFDEYASAYGVDTVMIAIPELDPNTLSKLNAYLSGRVENVKYLPNSDQMLTFASRVEDFDGLLMISTTQGSMKWYDHLIKRTIDIFGGLAGCAILLPLIGYVRYYNHKQGDYGPIFFTQNRIGKNGKQFKVYKFRTMVENAEQVLEKMMAENPEIRHEYEVNKKLQDDPRITRVGKFLREKSLDEFPQFINVLKGEMSLIGPRPYLPREAKDMGSYYQDIVSLAPGVTGMWQTHGRSNVDFERRLELDEFYYRNWSLWLDLTLLIKTIQNMYYGDDSAR
ncbi:exopolysaccharide biosynthesis polyprenyl glycosylphosphotransferase [Ileibacterium valens]|uniref:exopolysaccharide biosynthesis polyprenyl glycosylphosphotransferase n=1 Tax=Ileibacterium valens TaxID=1862668 RepID=UPI0024BB883F|nr:exopolysaccharide biosynthesis polyprenyl glycosylphosphotransferase [Ileibacterium valens]